MIPLIMIFIVPADTSVSLINYSDSTNPDPNIPPTGQLRNFYQI